MVVMFNGRVTDGDCVTLQRLRQCNVVYSNKLDSVVIPNIVTVHKRVEVRMEDMGTRAPHKFTSLNREFMMLADPILSAKGEVVYALHSLCVGWRNLPTLRMGWRNLFSSCAVVSIFDSGGK
jgi:hypothetical protein